MPCNATSQLTNAPSVPLQVTMPTNNAQWAVFVQRLQDAINATRDAANRQPVNVVPGAYAVYNGTALPALVVTGATPSLDNTLAQFGKASLKLVATAATVSVEFSADPIVIQPFLRWIASVYIQSSRASITGTLAVSTAAGLYPVDISGNLLPSTWGRLYGDCDLRADPSPTCTMILTFTGCSVGDVFHLEGWQMENASGATNLPSPFVNTAAPSDYVVTSDNASTALANANAAQASANQANAQLAQIASDGTLSPSEKPVVVRDYSVVTTEQAGIDAQAVAYLGASSAQQVAYDNAITALTNYLNGLTTPTAWNDKSGNTTIVAATFDSTWNAVYEKRQLLLNAIYQQAQSLANAAQSTANTAQTTGTNAQNTANTANTTANTANANTPTVINPNFSNGLNGWIAGGGWTSDATPRAIYTGFAGASGTLTIANTNNVPCQPGSQIIAQALLSSNAANGSCYAGVEFLDSTGAHLAYAFGSTITGTAVATLSRKVAVAPASAAFCRLFVGAANCTSGTYYAQNCLLTVTLSTVDELPDGSGRFAVVNGGGLNAVSAVDPNKKALIDFTQTGHTGKTLANIPDDPPSTRFAVSNIDGNRRALIDATQTGHIGAWNLDSRIADGVNYQRVGTGYADTSGRIVNLWDGTAIRSATNTWDGANRARTGLQSNGVLVSNLHPIDNLKDGTYARPLASQLQNGVPRGVSSGRNLITNGGFEQNVSNSACGDGWDGGGGLFGMVRANVGASSHSGAYVLQVNAAPGTVIPTGSTFVGANHYGINCHAGDTLYLGAWFENQGNTALFPANLTGTLDVQVVFLDANNNALSAPGNAVFANLTASGWQLETSTCVVPAGTVSTYAQILAYTTNNTGSAWTVPAGQYPFWAYTDDVFCYALTNLDTDAQDGVVHGRIAMADVFQTGGANRVGVRIAGSGQYAYVNFGDNTVGGHSGKHLGNIGDDTGSNRYAVFAIDANRRPYVDFTQTGHVGKNLGNMADDATSHRYAVASDDIYPSGGYNRIGLRVAGSGHQLGDQFNSPPIASANLRSTWTGQTISYSATAGSPATATISVTAATLLAGAASKAYNAMSVGVSGTGGNTATYYLYFDDPTYAGGAQTLVATTTGSNIYGANGRVYVGSIAVTFPTSGSGSGGGSGGGGACVALGTYGPQGRFDRETRCVYTPDGAVSVRKLKTSRQKCVRVKYDNGTVLTCSEDAPLMGGQRKVLAIDALGETLDTSKGSSRVRSIESAGILEVVSIDAGDVAYYASDNPDGPFALHHNKIIP